MNAIASPQLPPRLGYVETEVNGMREYIPVPLSPSEQDQAAKTVASEDALCELDAVYDQRLAAIEDALCELDAAQS